MKIPPRILAGVLAVGELGEPGHCAAWIDRADRVCGKPAPFGEWLCTRHITVAQRSARAIADRDRAATLRARAQAEASRPKRLAELSAIELRIAAIDPLWRKERGDVAEVNMPLAKRLPSDSRIEELALLHQRRARLLAIEEML